MKQEPKPKRPYKNLREFVVSYLKYRSAASTQAKLLDPNWWPCFKCDGDGRYRKDEDRDPIEGWKCAPTYRCEACNATGNGSKEHWAGEFKTLMDHFKNRLEDWIRVDRLIRSARKKLTPDERAVFGIK